MLFAILLPCCIALHCIYREGYGVSLMKRLADAHPGAVIPLTFQYRMNEEICKLSNVLVYKGSLKCANDGVRKQKLVLPAFPSGLSQQQRSDSAIWLRQVIDPANSVVFVNTDTVSALGVSLLPGSFSAASDQPTYFESSVSNAPGGNIINQTEASLTSFIVSGLVSCGVSPKEVGIITPFRAQVSVIHLVMSRAPVYTDSSYCL
jgi:DNA replication ATP-dependent helicase Dna2